MCLFTVKFQILGNLFNTSLDVHQAKADALRRIQEDRERQRLKNLPTEARTAPEGSQMTSPTHGLASASMDVSTDVNAATKSSSSANSMLQVGTCFKLL